MGRTYVGLSFYICTCRSKWTTKLKATYILPIDGVTEGLCVPFSPRIFAVFWVGLFVFLSLNSFSLSYSISTTVSLSLSLFFPRWYIYIYIYKKKLLYIYIYIYIFIYDRFFLFWGPLRVDHPTTPHLLLDFSSSLTAGQKWASFLPLENDFPLLVLFLFLFFFFRTAGPPYENKTIAF